MEQNKYFVKAYETMETWLSQPDLFPKLRRELSALEERLTEDSGDIETKEEICDRFYKNLDFGTGGLRGVLGAGTNRMNIYTVRRATQGLADYIIKNNDSRDKEPSVAIAYDSRINSNRFALEAGGVLAANGIKVYIFPEITPTPLLSFAVRYYGCSAGIMITASHNPSRYNGYKVYNGKGCQFTPKEAADILECIERIDIFNGVKTVDIDWESYVDRAFPENDAGKIMNVIPEKTFDAYIEEVLKNRIGIQCGNIEAVYTPLNGAGNKPVRRILSEIGVAGIHIVAEQEMPDGNFPTCPYPNPEKEEAMLKGLTLCNKLQTPDLLLVTDPDCDRLGIAVRQEDPESNKVSYKRMTGDEVGVLLLDFICSQKALPDRALVMKTIVSSRAAEKIASHYNIELINVLTGFKYIGEQIGILEEKDEEYRFVFGFEESNGYLAGTYVRDKDAVNAAMLVCEAAAYYKSEGKTLIDRMKELNEQYGYYLNESTDFPFEGIYGAEKMEEIMSSLRNDVPGEIGGKKVKEYADYLYSKRVFLDTSLSAAAGCCSINLPKANVLEYILEDDCSLFVRPSGTEPKLKVYLSAKGTSSEESKAVLNNMKSTVKGWINK